jgi:hypothetical protein
MNEGTAPPLGRGGCATNMMSPFLSGADGEGKQRAPLQQATALPKGGDVPSFMFGLPDSTFCCIWTTLLEGHDQN